MKKSLLVLAFALLLVPAPTLAQATSSVKRPGLADFQAKRLAKLMEADSDKDGRLSEAEWTARSVKAKNSERRFARLDTNSDGYLNQIEINAQLARTFAKRDADGDGRISSQERAARPSNPAPTTDK